jgi:photosystem II stability/assembly factor-like uncharacterized protein
MQIGPVANSRSRRRVALLVAAAILAALGTAGPQPTGAEAGSASRTSPVSSPASTTVGWTEIESNGSYPKEVRGISCPADSMCLLAADRLRRSVDGGQTWNVVPSAVTYWQMNDVDCVSATRCVAISDQGLALSTFDAAATWTDSRTGIRPQHLSCPSTSTCFAFGTSSTERNAPAAAVSSRDGGATWHPVILPASLGTAQVSDLDCPTETQCRAVGENFLLRTDDGTTWTMGTSNFGLKPVLGCTPTATCLVTDSWDASAVSRVGTDGATNLTIMTGLVGWRLNDIECVTDIRCVAVGMHDSIIGGVPAAVVINPSTATVSAATTSVWMNGLDLVDCGPTTCTTLGRDIEAMTTGRFASMTSVDLGGTFTLVSSPPIPSVRDLACTGPTRCLSVGDTGAPLGNGSVQGRVSITTDSGATWVQASVPPTIGTIKDVKCPTANRCLAIAETDRVTATPQVDLSFLDVYCPSATACLATAAEPGWPRVGRLLRSTDGGATWTDLPGWSPATRPYRIGCVDSARCLMTALSAQGSWELFASNDAGATWATRQPPAGRSPSGPIRCDLSSCLIVTGSLAHFAEVFATGDGGTTWTAVSGPATAERNCNASGACIALINDIRGHVFTSADGGAHWQEVGAPIRTQLFGTLDCPSPTRCYVATEGGSADGTASYRADLGSITATPAFTPVTPKRLLDTRTGGTTTDGSFAGIGIQQPGHRLELQITGRASIPTGATAAVLNITATAPTGNGYATAWPCDTPNPPNTSNLNYTTGQTIPNLVIAPLSPTGTICLQTTEAPTHLIADINGYFPRA